MIHVTIQQLSSYLDEQLAQGSADLVRQHLDSCPECGARLGALSRMDGAITRALTHEPDEAVLARIEREVAFAIGPDAKDKAQEILASGPAKRVSVRGIMAKSGAPVSAARRKSPSTPTVPSASATGSVAPKRTREVPATAWTPSTARGTTTPVPPPRRKQGSSSGMWVAVFALALIAGSAGVMVSHTGTVQGWLDSLVSSPNFTPSKPAAPSANPESVATAEAPSAMTAPPADSGLNATMTDALVPPPPPRVATPPHLAQVRDGEVQEESEWDEDTFTEGENAPQTMRADEVMASQSGGRPAAGRTSPGSSRQNDPYANLRPETQAAVRDAERVHQQTLFHPTAEQFDAAANRWERVLEGMSGPEQVTVRGRLADARYRAWETSPTPQRADAAISAIRSYLLFAPPGLAREEAKSRLEHLSPR